MEERITIKMMEQGPIYVYKLHIHPNSEIQYIHQVLKNRRLLCKIKYSEHIMARYVIEVIVRNNIELTTLFVALMNLFNIIKDISVDMREITINEFYTWKSNDCWELL